MKQKKVVAVGLGILTLILVVLPLLVFTAQAQTHYCPWWCDGMGQCTGDVSWVTDLCYMYCRTGSTTSDALDCGWPLF